MFCINMPNSNFKSMHCPIKMVCVWADKACFSVTARGNGVAVTGGGERPGAAGA